MRLQNLNEEQSIINRKPILKTIVSIKEIDESNRKHWTIYEMTDNTGRIYKVNIQNMSAVAERIFGNTDGNKLKTLNMSTSKKIWIYPKNKFGYHSMRLTKEAKQ